MKNTVEYRVGSDPALIFAAITPGPTGYISILNKGEFIVVTY